jgi:hypothetical protein
MCIGDAADSAGQKSPQRVSLVGVEALEDVVLDLFLIVLAAFDGFAPGVGDRDFVTPSVGGVANA